MRKKVLQIPLDGDIWEEINKISEKKGITVAEVTRRILVKDLLKEDK